MIPQTSHAQPASVDEWNTVAASLIAEGQGVLRLTFFRARDLPEIIIGCEAGDPASLQALNLFTEIGRLITTRAPAEPIRCLLCPVAFDPEAGRFPSLFTLLHPATDEPGQAIVHMLCPDCCNQRDRLQIQRDVPAAIRRVCGIELRMLHIHAEGHA